MLFLLTNDDGIDAAGLAALAGAVEGLGELWTVAPATETSPTDVQDSLTATIDLGVKLRRNELMEALADDVGLTEARLNSAYAALEALAGARSVSLIARFMDSVIRSAYKIAVPLICRAARPMV